MMFKTSRVHSVRARLQSARPVTSAAGGALAALAILVACGSEASEPQSDTSTQGDAGAEAGAPPTESEPSDASSPTTSLDLPDANSETDSPDASTLPTADAGDDGDDRDESNDDGTPVDAGDVDVDAGSELAPEAGSVLPNGQCLGLRSSHASHAASSGFTGSEDDYFALYDVPCTASSECSSACEAIGGTVEMCAFSECLEQFEDAVSSCLPPPVWRNLDNIGAAGMTTLDSAELTLVALDYHDLLLTDDLALELPEAATILGISVQVRRAGDERVLDHSVKLQLGGEPVGSEYAKPEPWSMNLDWITYGGSDDLWGRQWSASEVSSPDFGLAIAVQYAADAGNTRAYVEDVNVTVYYEAACDR
jgi:hypothetical protein